MIIVMMTMIVSHTLSPQHMNNFAEFVKAFCDFGLEMVELSVTTRWHLNQVFWSGEKCCKAGDL